jgi:hypothetical protein
MHNYIGHYRDLLTSRLYYEYYRLVCIYTTIILFCSKMLCRSIICVRVCIVLKTRIGRDVAGYAAK